MSIFISTKDGRDKICVISKSRSDVGMRKDYWVDEYIDSEHRFRYMASTKVIAKLLRVLAKRFINRCGSSNILRQVDSIDVMVHRWSKKRTKSVWTRACVSCGINRRVCGHRQDR